MSDTILNMDRSEEMIRGLRGDRSTNIQLAALLVTLLLHGLFFWWGLSSARFYAPSEEKMQAIRVFLPSMPMALPAPAAPPCPAGAKPVPAAGPAVPPPVVPVPREALLPPASVPFSPGPVETAPETSPGPVGTISVAPLPAAAAAVVSALPVAAVSRSGRETGPVTAAPVFAGGGEVGAADSAGGVGAGNESAGTGKERYLRTLFAHIEAHKFYPPSARRRRLEGQVRVAFTIDASGGVSDLKVSEGYPLLEEAALQTVRSALPLPLPAGGVSLPFSLSYRMDFRLR